MPDIALGRNGQLRDQLFSTPDVLAAECVYLAFFSLAFLVSIHRFRYAPAMGWMLLYTATQVAAFAMRIWIYEHDSYSLALFRAMLALLAIGFLLLCETVLILIGEHFNTAIDRWGRRHRGFIHFLTALLVGAFVAAVLYACWVAGRDLNNAVQAYIVLLLILLGLLLLHQIFRTPHLTYYQTTMMLLFVTLLLVLCPIYLEIKHLTAHLQSSLAFYLMWVLPQALVTLALLVFDTAVWYPNYRSAWIY